MLTNRKADFAEKAMTLGLILLVCLAAIGAIGAAISAKAWAVAHAIQ